MVEVIADLGKDVHPQYRYGSGCLVAGRTVLTAAHVVAGAIAVVVRDRDKTVYEAALDSALIGYPDGPDLALIDINDASIDVPAIEFAIVDRDSQAGHPVERCHVIGYPAFMERRTPDGSQVRHHRCAWFHPSALATGRRTTDSRGQ